MHNSFSTNYLLIIIYLQTNDPLHPTEEESNSALLASILYIIQKSCDNQVAFLVKIYLKW